MLALTRRVGEEIVIGDPRQPLGVIRIVEIHGDKVRLSFDFPRTTPINRKELADLKAKHDSPPGPPAGATGSVPPVPGQGGDAPRGGDGSGAPPAHA
jgi:carbon storage regulator